MTERSFSLIPFPSPGTPDISITGNVARLNNELSIQYTLSGGYENILFPDISKRPMRKDELWKASCFEFFLAMPDEPKYWEFNMSPSGDWNVYRMDAYRRIGFREETSIQQLPFTFQREAGCVSVEATVDLSTVVPPKNPVQLGITSVLQTMAGDETYWALAHPNPQADFHLRESFIIRL